MTTALASLLTDRPVRLQLAMTGEISLRGKVMPIGGLKEKVLAAQRAGITRVILPKRNEKDLAEVPAAVRAEMQFGRCSLTVSRQSMKSWIERLNPGRSQSMSQRRLLTYRNPF